MGAGAPDLAASARRAPLPATPLPYRAEAFLRAVVEGREPADPNRIAAARSLLRYETPAKRVPPPTKSVNALARSASLERDRDRRAEFDARAAAVRAKHGRCE